MICLGVIIWDSNSYQFNHTGVLAPIKFRLNNSTHSLTSVLDLPIYGLT